MSKRKISPEEMASFADPSDTEPVGELGQVGLPVPVVDAIAIVGRELEAMDRSIASTVAPLGGIPDGPGRDLIVAALRSNPGIPAAERDGWRGRVIAWAAFASEAASPADGELSIVPTLALVSHPGTIIRLYGWPALSSWAQIVRALGENRFREGVPCVVRRRPSGTAGRSYWVIEIDAPFNMEG